MSNNSFAPGGAPNPNAFQPYAAPVASAPPGGGSNVWKYLLFGCLGFFFILLLFCGGVGVYFYYNAGKMMAGLARTFIVEMVNQSELSAEDKQQVIAQVDRVVDAYKAGRLTSQDMEKVAQELQKSPLPIMFMTYAAKAKYIDQSGLTDEEKRAANQALMRFGRGVIDKKISESDAQALFDSVTEPGPGSEKKLKESLTDQELRDLIAKAKKLADDAQIPEEIPPVDIGDEIERVLNNALGDKLK